MNEQLYKEYTCFELQAGARISKAGRHFNSAPPTSTLRENPLTSPNPYKMITRQGRK